MRTKRKGLDAGHGSGYRNVLRGDSRVHSDSAMGKKQPNSVVRVNSLKRRPYNRGLKYDIPRLKAKRLSGQDVKLVCKGKSLFVDGDEYVYDSSEKCESDYLLLRKFLYMC